MGVERATFAAASLTIGAQGGGSGAVIISGAGSNITLSGALNVGGALGTGGLTMGPGVAMHAAVVNLQGQVVMQGGLLDPTVQVINKNQAIGGFGTIVAGTLIDEGVIEAGTDTASPNLLLVEGTVLGGGTLTVNGTPVASKPAGVPRVNAGGTLELAGAVLNAARTTVTDDTTPAGTYTVNDSVVDVTTARQSGCSRNSPRGSHRKPRWRGKRAGRRS